MNYTVSEGFPYYIELVENFNYKSLFQSEENIKTLGNLSEEQASYRYATGKWSVKQIIGHITDHERIMLYRALCFSRNDQTLLPGYDENFYVNNARFDEQPFSQLLNDFKNVRKSSISFIESLSEEQLQLTGKAWKYELTVQDFLKATIGHEIHHFKVIKEKYLNAFL